MKLWVHVGKNADCKYSLRRCILIYQGKLKTWYLTYFSMIKIIKLKSGVLSTKRNALKALLFCIFGVYSFIITNETNRDF